MSCVRYYIPPQYVLQDSNKPNERACVYVPIFGVLANFSPRDHPKNMAGQAFTRVLDSDMGIVSVELENLGSAYICRQLLICWVPERGEWVGIIYSASGNEAVGVKRSFSDPVELSNFCTMRLLCAYGYPEEAIVSFIEKHGNLSTANYMSPEGIRKLVRKEQNLRRPVEH